MASILPALAGGIQLRKLIRRGPTGHHLEPDRAIFKQKFKRKRHWRPKTDNTHWALETLPKALTPLPLNLLYCTLTVTFRAKPLTSKKWFRSGHWFMMPMSRELSVHPELN